jgi:hypothetical protein
MFLELIAGQRNETRDKAVVVATLLLLAPGSMSEEEVFTNSSRDVFR